MQSNAAVAPRERKQPRALPVDKASYDPDVAEALRLVMEQNVALPCKMKPGIKIALEKEGFIFTSRRIGPQHHCLNVTNIARGWIISYQSENEECILLWLLDPKGNRRAKIRISKTGNYRNTTSLSGLTYYSYGTFPCDEHGVRIFRRDHSVKLGVWTTCKGAAAHFIGYVNQHGTMTHLGKLAKEYLIERHPNCNDFSAYWNDK